MVQTKSFSVGPSRGKRDANSSTAWLKFHAQTNDRIKIYIAPSCKKFANRIELSSGTRLADAHETTQLIHGATYQEGARLPREPWRRPTAKEAESLIVTEVPRNMAASIAIVRLPGEFTDDRREAIRNANTESLEINFLQPLRTICELGEPLHCVGPITNPANLKTVTINRKIGRYNGLHVDSWDQRDLDSLHLATNRVCINIGKSDRYFMFLPLSLMDITRVLSEEMGPDWGASAPSVIGRQFMERFPDLPAIRCRLAPGEAYIAPTENIVHDGSSVGQSDIDEQFTIRGRIRPL